MITNMAFSNFLIYSDLMKQLSASQPSEMAVSLVSSSSPISTPSPLKRHLVNNPTAIDHSPVTLLSHSLSTKMNGSLVEPIAKKLKLDASSPRKSVSESRSHSKGMLNGSTAKGTSASIESLKNGIKMLSSDLDKNGGSYCGWMTNNTSPLSRHPETGDAPDSPQPPVLNPITPAHESAAAGPLEPPPLVIKPTGLGVNSPSRCSTDGEVSVENTDPNADPTEGHEVCPDCHKVFKRKIYLQRHMEREHWSTAKVFKCEDCNYETKHQSNLSVHRRTHTGERPYHCGACGQRYTQGHLLKSHIRSRHGGNMQFYNLDKKSDSTRGRKSLDIKHDGVGVGHRQDKISTLLQAAAAASSNQTSAAAAPKSPFGNIMPPYMNSLAPYYGLQQGISPSNLSVRPMMAGSPLAALNAGILSAGSRFFALGGGLANNLPPTSSMLPKVAAAPSLSIFSAPSSMPLTSPHSSLAASPLKAAEEERKAANGLLMMKTTSSEQKRNALTSSPSKVSTPSPRQQDPAEEEGGPEDLSVKHHEDETRVTPPLSPAVSHTATPTISNSNESLVISHQSEGSEASSQLPQSQFPQSPLVRYHSNEGESTPPPSVSPDDASVMQDQYNADESDNEETGSMGDCESRVDSGLSPTRMMTECCEGKLCSHANQLTRLRKNVMRMLRCFAPEFSENNIDYSTVEVDQLLYDIMFANMDEKLKK